MNSTAMLAANPFALMVDPQRVQAVIARSKSLNKLRNRECHPLDRAVIRSASAELAAWDSSARACRPCRRRPWGRTPGRRRW